MVWLVVYCVKAECSMLISKNFSNILWLLLEGVKYYCFVHVHTHGQTHKTHTNTHTHKQTHTDVLMYFADWIRRHGHYDSSPAKITCNTKSLTSRRVDLQRDDYLTAKLLCSQSLFHLEHPLHSVYSINYW